jgi:hypothetical protein
MTCNGRYWCIRSLNPKMESLWRNPIRVWNEAMRTSQLGLPIDPKSDSSVSKVVQQMSLKHFNGGSYTQCHLEEDLML